jgi:hypothetical protein
MVHLLLKRGYEVTAIAQLLNGIYLEPYADAEFVKVLFLGVVGSYLGREVCYPLRRLETKS